MELAKHCLELASRLTEMKQFVLANQLARSGTSVGANIVEAKYAESKKDFIHKMKIAEKELHETGYWIELIELTCNITAPIELKQTLEESRKIIVSIVLSAKSNI